MKRLIGLVAMALPATGLAGPFGYEMGQNVAQLQSSGLTKENAAVYGFRAATPPSPHPDFKQYILLITPKQGLCRIVALTEPSIDAKDGRSIRKKFLELQEALTRRYGDPSTTNGQTDSPQAKSDEFISRLVRGDHVWWTGWSGRPGKEMPDNIDGLELKMNASREGLHVFLSLTYDFTNSGQCLKENQAATDASL